MLWGSRSISTRSTKKQKYRCQCEALEPRIVLSATMDTPASDAVPSGLVATPLTSISYPGHITVTDSKVIVGDETIPRFVAHPTVTSVRSGLWSDPKTWSTGSVPKDNDRVSISASTAVGYSTVSNVRLDGLEISGRLTFSTTVNTRMTVGNVMVMPTGVLQIGTAASPVAASVKAELVIADRPLNLTSDPEQFGTGLIVMGTVSIRGSSRAETWDRLAAEPRVGDTSLLLADTFAGWKPGDKLVLPDSRQVVSSQDWKFKANQVPPQWETVTIDHIQGNRVYLTAPLQFNHLGARNSAGGLELLPHVALLSRNVVIRSENPQGTRGHTYFTARANVDIEYAAFDDLGRGNAMIDEDNTTFDAAGNVTHVGTNQRGRTAVDFYDLAGPVNAANTGYQFQFVGNTVERSMKWAVALYDSSYGLLKDNVIYDAQGGLRDGRGLGNQQ